MAAFNQAFPNVKDNASDATLVSTNYLAEIDGFEGLERQLKVCNERARTYRQSVTTNNATALKESVNALISLLENMGAVLT